MRINLRAYLKRRKRKHIYIYRYLKKKEKKHIFEKEGKENIYLKKKERETYF